VFLIYQYLVSPKYIGKNHSTALEQTGGDFLSSIANIIATVASKNSKEIITEHSNTAIRRCCGILNGTKSEKDQFGEWLQALVFQLTQ